MKHPARILVVDDEAGMLRAVERVLAGPHRVIGTPSSAQAVAVAATFKPDLVILDIRMPELDGFELMERLKADHPGVDIILMTGSVDDLDQKLIRAIRAARSISSRSHSIGRSCRRSSNVASISAGAEKRIDATSVASSRSWNKRAPFSRRSSPPARSSPTSSLSAAATSPARSVGVTRTTTPQSARVG